MSIVYQQFNTCYLREELGENMKVSVQISFKIHATVSFCDVTATSAAQNIYVPYCSHNS